MGDFKFDPAQWPDVPGMMSNLTKHYKIDQVMVSTWPFIATGSDSFEEFGSQNLVFDTEGTVRADYSCFNSFCFTTQSICQVEGSG